MSQICLVTLALPHLLAGTIYPVLRLCQLLLMPLGGHLQCSLLGGALLEQALKASNDGLLGTHGALHSSASKLLDRGASARAVVMLWGSTSLLLESPGSKQSDGKAR